VAVVKVAAAAAAARPISLPSCPQLVVGAAAAYGKDVGPSPFLWIDESIMLDKEYESISERAKSNRILFSKGLRKSLPSRSLLVGPGGWAVGGYGETCTVVGLLLRNEGPTSLLEDSWTCTNHQHWILKIELIFYTRSVAYLCASFPLVAVSSRSRRSLSLLFFK
jgi:hypothetical protein